jgi:hypothetical protein
MGFGDMGKQSDKSDHLYTDDHPETTIHGLKFKDKEAAEASVNKLKNLLKKGETSRQHAMQAAVSMEQRAKHHAKPTKDMKEAAEVWRAYVEELKK